jgi:hypothetical protein
LNSGGAAAEAARCEFRELLEQKGHAVDNARAAMARLESAFADGVLERTAAIDETLADLRLAIERDEGQKLGGKSAEAARFITRRLSQLIDDA